MDTVIEREIHVAADPGVVFQVVSTPEHLAKWWPDGAEFAPVAAATGEIWFGDRDKVAQFTVVEVDPPRRFSFRWCHPAGATAAVGNSLLVTFDLEPSGTGTLVRMTETGFREICPDAETLAREYASHVEGWGIFIPRLAEYVTRLTAVG